MSLLRIVSELFPENLKRSRDPVHIRSVVIYHACTPATSTQNLKCLFTFSRDMIGPIFKEMRPVTLITPLSGVVCL